MSGQFGKLRKETADIFEEASKASPSYVRLFVWCASFFRDAKTLNASSTERKWLDSWAEANGLTESIGELQIVQFSKKEAADSLFNGHPQSAQNAIRGILEKGLLVRIQTGIKGHSSLYAVMPLPPNKVKHEIDPKEEGNGVKPSVDPKEGNGVKMPP